MLNLKALLVTDVQNDFCPGGTLAIRGGDTIIPVLNSYVKLFAGAKLPVFVSRDWHPERTVHFKDFGGIWPVHCVQNSEGAKFHPALQLTKEAIIVSKGMDPAQDSYSVFQAADANGTDFAALLKSYGVKELYVGGLATDYCVKWTVLDSLQHGYKTYLLTDAIKGVNVAPADSDKAIQEMVLAGVKKIAFEKIRV